MVAQPKIMSRTVDCKVMGLILSGPVGADSWFIRRWALTLAELKNIYVLSPTR